MSEFVPDDDDPVMATDIANALCDELGATSVITSYDPPYGKYITTVTFTDGRQAQGSGDTAGSAIENAKAAANILTKSVDGSSGEVK